MANSQIIMIINLYCTGLYFKSQYNDFEARITKNPTVGTFDIYSLHKHRVPLGTPSSTVLYREDAVQYKTKPFRLTNGFGAVLGKRRFLKSYSRLHTPCPATHSSYHMQRQGGSQQLLILCSPDSSDLACRLIVQYAHIIHSWITLYSSHSYSV